MQLAEPVAYALDGLQQALHVRASFDPTPSDHRLTMAMTGVGEMYFLPVLMDSLAQAAPTWACCRNGKRASFSSRCFASLMSA